MKKKNAGQGLVEYLILVALMGVATIAIVKILQNTVNINFARVVNSLQGQEGKNPSHERVDKSHYKKRDFGDFMHGTVNREKKK